MRMCTSCLELKINEEFYFKNKALNKLHTQCKECYAIKRKKSYFLHYLKEGSKYRDRAITRNKLLRADIKNKMLNYLSDKTCEKCGINDPRVLDFDHIDPKTKDFGIAHGLHNTMNWERLLKEIEKCQILCANCHRIKTATDNQWYKSI